MLNDDMESALTVGGSLSQTFRLAGDDQTTISFDYFRTQFLNTMVFDQETADNTILIYNTTMTVVFLTERLNILPTKKLPNFGEYEQ